MMLSWYDKQLVNIVIADGLVLYHQGVSSRRNAG